MAQIREYNNQQVIQQDPLQTAARRQEVLGIEAGGEIQSGANALAEGVKRTEEHIAQTETSKVAADLATAHANLSKQWNDTVASADPNDHELAQRFIDQNVRPTFDKIGQGLVTQQGQEYFQRASASAHAELFTKTSADQVRLAGEAAVTNLDTLRNQQSNMVRQDPTTLQHALDTASDESLTRLFPTLPPEARQTLGRSMRTDFAKSAAEGAIDQNADSAKVALERGDLNDHLDGPTVQTLIQRANERIKANENGNKAAEVEQRRQEKAAFDTAMAKSAASLIDPDTGENRVPPNYFQNLAKTGEMPGAEAGAINAGRAAGLQLMRAPVLHSDPDVRSDFLGRVWRDNDDPSKLTLTDINAAYGTGALSKADHTMLRQDLIDAQKDPAKAENMRSLGKALTSFKAYISKSTLLSSDKDGDVRFGQFQQDKTDQFKQGLASGVSSKDMLDPRSKNYLFSDVQRYQPQTDLKRFQQSVTGNVPPIGPAPVVPWAGAPSYTGAPPNARPSNLPQRKPGESVDDFLKRAQ